MEQRQPQGRERNNRQATSRCQGRGSRTGHLVPGTIRYTHSHQLTTAQAGASMRQKIMMPGFCWRSGQVCLLTRYHWGSLKQFKVWPPQPGAHFGLHKRSANSACCTGAVCSDHLPERGGLCIQVSTLQSHQDTTHACRELAYDTSLSQAGVQSALEKSEKACKNGCGARGPLPRWPGGLMC